MIKYLRWLFTFLVFQLAACATANLSAFSDETATLMASLNGQHQAIAGKMNEVVALANLAKAEGWFREPVFPSDDGSAEEDVAILARTFDPSGYTEIRRQFISRSQAIQETHNAIAAYATALAELAAAGETGTGAVQKSVDTLNGIVNTLGGPAGIIGGTAVDLLGEIGDLITRAQAQERIEDAMGILAGPDGALRKTVQLLELALDTLDTAFIENLYTQVNVLEQYHHGPGLIAFYNGSNSWMYRNRAFYLLRMDDEARSEFIQNTTEEEIYEALRACLDDKPGCPQASLAAGLASRLTLIADIEDEFRSFETAKARNSEWRNRQVSSITRSKQALRAWTDQHDAIYTSLETCGGFKALKPGCGNWSEASLASAIARLENILPDTTPPARATEGGPP